MTNSSGDGLLDHAKRLCSALETLSNAYLAYERGDGCGGVRDGESVREGINAIQSAWETTLPICIEAGKFTPGKSGTIADWIRDAGKWCKWFAETIQKQGFSETVFVHNCDGVHRVVRDGWRVLDSNRKADDPFAFVESATTHNLTVKADENEIDRMFYDPTFQSESPQREMLSMLESLSEVWQAISHSTHSQRTAIGVLSNAKAIDVRENGKWQEAHLTSTGIRWKRCLKEASEIDRPKWNAFVLRLARDANRNVGERNTIVKQHINAWSKADFLHQAQMLARRLAVWHVDDRGPVWTPKGIDFRREVERSFRYRVMLGEHELQRNFASATQLIPIPPTGNSDSSLVGQAVKLHPDEYSKDATIWLFRDFYEHLGQLGDSEAEKLLGLKVEQLLDSRMYRRAHSDVLGDYIAGHQVDQSLLDELVEAAKFGAFQNDRVQDDRVPKPHLQAIDLAVGIPERIVSKRRTFELIRKRFEEFETRDAPLFQLRLIERRWTPKPEQRGMLHDFTEVEASPGWKLIERHDNTELSGEYHQIALYVLDHDSSGTNQNTFERWRNVADLAGDDLRRNSNLAGDSCSIRGPSRWVWLMKQLASRNLLTLPLNTGYLDHELWLRAIKAENARSSDANELLEATERNGTETLCTDAFTASILFADWLANNDWPFESCEKKVDKTKQKNCDSVSNQLTHLLQPVDALRANESVTTLVTKSDTDRRSIEEIERNTPELNTQSIEWIGARKENREKLGYPTSTLATYRLASSGGRQLSPYFGIDKDGRRWRRCKTKTEGSTVFYFQSDL